MLFLSLYRSSNSVFLFFAISRGYLRKWYGGKSVIYGISVNTVDIKARTRWKWRKAMGYARFSRL